MLYLCDRSQTARASDFENKSQRLTLWWFVSVWFVWYGAVPSPAKPSQFRYLFVLSPYCLSVWKDVGIIRLCCDILYLITEEEEEDGQAHTHTHTQPTTTIHSSVLRHHTSRPYYERAIHPLLLPVLYDTVLYFCRERKNRDAAPTIRDTPYYYDDWILIMNN